MCDSLPIGSPPARSDHRAVMAHDRNEAERRQLLALATAERDRIIAKQTGLPEPIARPGSRATAFRSRFRDLGSDPVTAALATRPSVGATPGELGSGGRRHDNTNFGASGGRQSGVVSTCRSKGTVAVEGFGNAHLDRAKTNSWPRAWSPPHDERTPEPELSRGSDDIGLNRHTGPRSLARRTRLLKAASVRMRRELLAVETGRRAAVETARSAAVQEVLDLELRRRETAYMTAVEQAAKEQACRQKLEKVEYAKAYMSAAAVVARLDSAAEAEARSQAVAANRDRREAAAAARAEKATASLSAKTARATRFKDVSVRQ